MFYGGQATDGQPFASHIPARATAAGQGKRKALPLPYTMRLRRPIRGMVGAIPCGCPGPWSHFPWPVVTIALARGHTFPGTRLHLPRHEVTIALARGHTFPGPWSHFPWPVVALALARGYTFPGPWLHFPWPVVTLSLARGYTFPGPWSHFPWPVVTLSLARGYNCPGPWLQLPWPALLRLPWPVVTIALARGYNCSGPWLQLLWLVVTIALASAVLQYQAWRTRFIFPRRRSSNIEASNISWINSILMPRPRH